MAGPSRLAWLDPALQPLPEQDEDELASLHHGKHSPARKIAGSRRAAKRDLKGKGKARADADFVFSRTATQGTKRGRSKGAPNYRDEEVMQLLDFVEEELPIGGIGWLRVGSRMRGWAKKHGYPSRTDKSLENKFKQVRFSLPCHQSIPVLTLSLASQNLEANW